MTTSSNLRLWMNVYDDTEYDCQIQIAQNKNEEANVALIHHGYLGASPSQPTIAFTLEALEFYHQLRRRQANFSVQAFVKVLCVIHNVCLAFHNIQAY
jgi:CxC1 like cysteine cluster associated with KDZ transposases